MRLLLGILAFGIWSFGSGYWYVCKIKGHCWGEDLRPVEIVNEGLPPEEVPSSEFEFGVASEDEELPEAPISHLPMEEEVSPPVGDLPEALQAPHTVLFAYAKPVIAGKAKTDAYIAALVGYLNSNPQARVRIAGYTDDTAAKWKNKELSMKRAEAIAVMLDAEGVSREKMDLEAMGEADPVATNETPAGRRLNRRAEITVINP